MVNRRVSLADVARRAGVSSNTVSRVVRNDPEVSDATRKRIQELLEELDYKPNLAARALARSRTGVIHVLLAAPMFHGHAQTFLSITNAAAIAGFHVSVSDAQGPSSRVPKIHHGLTPIDVDGVIVIGGQGPTLDLAVELGERVPTVLVLAGEHGFDKVSTVSVDNVLGARRAVEYLISLGVTDLLHIAGPVDWVDSGERLRGFREVCEERGLTPHVVQADSWDAADGYRLSKKWRCPPAGLFAANDQLALGAIRAMLEAGVRLPEESRVVGYDDIVGAECFFPPLSTVRQDFAAVGRSAVELLNELMNDQPSRDTVIEPSLVIRASS